MDAIISALANLGIGGACAGAILWFHWYTVTKTIPGLLDTFGQQMAAERKQCADQHAQIIAVLSAQANQLQKIEDKIGGKP